MSDGARLSPPERQWRGVMGLLLPLGVGLAPAAVSMDVSVCGFRHLTGLPCQLCGGTRVCAALAQGDLSAALQLNPGLLPVLAVAGLHSVLLLTETVSGRGLGQHRALARVLVRAWQWAGGFLLASWLWRLLA